MSGFFRLFLAIIVFLISFAAGYYFLVMPVQSEITVLVGQGNAYGENGEHCFTPAELDQLLNETNQNRVKQILEKKGVLCSLKFKEIELKQAEEDLKKWENAVSEFEKVLKQLQSEIGGSKEDFISSLLKDLTSLINELRMEDPDFVLHNIQFGTLSKETLGGEEGGGFATQSVTVRMSLTGHYSTLIKLMDELGQLKLKKMVRITGLNVSTAGRLEPGKSPVLRISLTLKAFLFTGGG